MFYVMSNESIICFLCTLYRIRYLVDGLRSWTSSVTTILLATKWFFPLSSITNFSPIGVLYSLTCIMQISLCETPRIVMFTSGNEHNAYSLPLRREALRFQQSTSCFLGFHFLSCYYNLLHTEIRCIDWSFMISLYMDLERMGRILLAGIT